MSKRKDRDEDEELSLGDKIRRLEAAVHGLQATRDVTVAGCSNQEEEVVLEDEGDELPEELLLALGTEGEDKPVTGPPINKELASRWSKIMNVGLGKEAREGIIKKYPVPDNFRRATAPVLNAEISIRSEVAIKRERRLIKRQNLLGSLMTCLGNSLTNILKGEINSKKLVEEVNDAAKIAADIFYEDSSARKFFALSGASKPIQEALKSCTPDEFLFGKDCPEKIKAAQSIIKTGAQIRTKDMTKGITPAAANKQQGNRRSLPQPNQQHHQQQRARGGQQKHLQSRRRAESQPEPPLRRRSQRQTRYPSKYRRY